MPVRMALKSIQTINAGEGAEKSEPSYTVGGNANQYSHYEEQCGDSLKKQEIELPYDPEIPLLGTQWQSNVSAFEYAIQVGHNFPSKE